MSEHMYLVGKEVTQISPYVSRKTHSVRVAGAHKELGITLKDVDTGNDRFCLNKELYHTYGIAEVMSYEEYYDLIIGMLIVGRVDERNHTGLANHYDQVSGCSGSSCAFQ